MWSLNWLDKNSELKFTFTFLYFTAHLLHLSIFSTLLCFLHCGKGLYGLPTARHVTSFDFPCSYRHFLCSIVEFQSLLVYGDVEGLNQRAYFEGGSLVDLDSKLFILSFDHRMAIRILGVLMCKVDNFINVHCEWLHFLFLDFNPVMIHAHERGQSLPIIWSTCHSCCSESHTTVLHFLWTNWQQIGENGELIAQFWICL